MSHQTYWCFVTCSKHTEITGTTSVPNLDSDGKDHDIKDNMQKLINHYRGGDEILKLLGLDDQPVVDAGFKRNEHSETITCYHILEEREFGEKI